MLWYHTCMARSLGVDTARYLHESFDDDTMIVDTVQGRLTLLVGAGSAVWSRVAAGTDVDVVVAEATDRYGAEAGAQVVAFVDELVSLGLLSEGGQPAEGQPRPWADTFVPPALEHYDDIADIMTMDPIHEVDTERGWPHRGH